MSQQTQLFDSVHEVNLGVSEPAYFGVPLDVMTRESLRDHGLAPTGDLYRHSYLYHVDYPVSSKEGSTVGAIELRARTWTYAADLSGPLRDTLKAVAHRAAEMYDTGMQTPQYAGYLTGFHVINPGTSWESERVGSSAGSQAQPGKIDWNVEVYDGDKNLSGIAQGIANPWTHTVVTVPGREPVHVAPHKWTLSFNPTREGGTYDVHADGRTQARERYRAGGAGAGKRLHINGKPIGKLDSEGRTWLTPEYEYGDGHTTSGSFGTYWSREGIVSETRATYQALRKGGRLYLTGETQDAVHLRTAGALPEGYEPAEHDDVSPGLEVEPGTDPTDWHVLGLRSTNDPTPLECRRDEKIIRHLGMSTPTYHHDVPTGWRGP